MERLLVEVNVDSTYFGHNPSLRVYDLKNQNVTNTMSKSRCMHILKIINYVSYLLGLLFRKNTAYLWLY